MQKFYDVESTLKPEKIQFYGEYGIDYNYNIREIEHRTNKPKLDDIGEIVYDENGEIEVEEYIYVDYLYDCVRLDSKEEYEREKNRLPK